MDSPSPRSDLELGNLPLGRSRRRKFLAKYTWKVTDVSVAEALKVGYRHIDCALVSPISSMMMVVTDLQIYREPDFQEMKIC
jgi:hypothetical protein